MIRAVTFHAIDRLRERRGISHVQEHLDMIRECNLPSDGIFEHVDGWRYVVKDGVLVTILPPDKAAKKRLRNEELLHLLTKTITRYPEAFEDGAKVDEKK